MAIWFPSAYDFIMSPLEKLKFKHIRKELLQGLSGRVLEIGSGTGINFPLYQKGNIEVVHAIEPDKMMAAKSEERKKKARVPIQIHIESAENLSFPDQSIDTVVATLVFCTIPDPVKALQEVRRVSKPRAPVLFFEHVRMEQPFMGKMQDILNPAWKRFADGCQLNRDTLGLIKEAGFEVKNVKSYYKGLFLVIECVNS